MAPGGHMQPVKTGAPHRAQTLAWTCGGLPAAGRPLFQWGRRLPPASRIIPSHRANDVQLSPEGDPFSRQLGPQYPGRRTAPRPRSLVVTREDTRDNKVSPPGAGGGPCQLLAPWPGSPEHHRSPRCAGFGWGSSASWGVRPGGLRSWTLFARGRPSDKADLVSRSPPHAAWSPSGLKGGALANMFDSREAQKIFWLFDRAWRGQTDTRFETAPGEAGYDHSAWRTLLPTPAEREVWWVLRVTHGEVAGLAFWPLSKRYWT